MGRPLNHQKRGKGTPRYRAPSHRYTSEVKYLTYGPSQKESRIRGQVLDLVHSAGHYTPLALVEYEDGGRDHILASEGLVVNDEIFIGAEAPVQSGNIKPLSTIPEGVPVFNVERRPGDGGKLLRSSGAYGFIVTKEGPKASLRLSSGKTIKLDLNCRATLGICAGGGRTDKPLLRAGTHYFKKKARNKMWPKVRGVKQNAIDHPHGGSQHHRGKPDTVRRDTPPGRKVGKIAPRRTGRK